jgi:hypothetical protein
LAEDRTLLPKCLEILNKMGEEENEELSEKESEHINQFIKNYRHAA